VFVSAFVVELVLVCVFVALGGLGVLEDLDVNDVAGRVGVVAAVVVLLACVDPPQPAIASAATSAPES
jgi:hypothetical protein